MTAYFQAAVKYLPAVSLAVLVLTLLLLELRERGSAGSNAARNGSAAGFGSPLPSKGYTYHLSASASVLIRSCGFGNYRIYPIKGETPAGLALLADRYGSYFSLRARSNDAAERELDRLYLEGGGI